MERSRKVCFEINSKEFECGESFDWTSWSRETREVGRVETTQKHLLSLLFDLFELNDMLKIVSTFKPKSNVVQ